MRAISPKFRKIINTDQFYKRCSNPDGHCRGRMTIEHAWKYSGRQIDELWNFIPLCWEHHLGARYERRLGQYFSLLLASPEDLKKYPKKDWKQEFINLHNQYGNDDRTKGFRAWCKLTQKKLYDETA